MKVLSCLQGLSPDIDELYLYYAPRQQLRDQARRACGILAAVLSSPPGQEVFAPFGYGPRRLLAPAPHDLHTWTS